MKLKLIDVTEKDLEDKNSTWHGPVHIHWHTAEQIQYVLDRHNLDLVLAIQNDNMTIAHVDVVPKQEQVESSMLGNISYDETTHKMSITFKHGSRYDYFDVEKAIYHGLRDAPSKGKFFHKHVKSHYRCKQVD
ncbi:MAG: KTSC domain-containing protein [Promethearchaeota archaeon]|jgi:lysyl-tRNA synthetase class 2